MRKNKFLIFIFTCLWFFLLEGCFRRDIKNIESPGRNIICFGDSITYGYGVGPGEDYPTTLGKLSLAKVINAGVDGDTTVDALKRLKVDVLDRDPLLVVIEFGGNDFIKGVPKETTISNIRGMVEAIQAKGAMVAVVDISAGLFFAEYRGPFKNIADETGSIFIPRLLEGIITNPSMKSDFLHPNPDGYKIIAHRIYRAIFNYLNQNTIIKGFNK